MGECRKQFEHWMSDEGASLRAIEKGAGGIYKLLGAQNNWTAWQAAWKARAAQTVGPLDGMVEGARRDLESIATMKNSTNEQPVSFTLGTVASSCLNTVNALHDRCQHLQSQLDSLQDGATVWVNILRGTIGRPAAVDEYFELRERLQSPPPTTTNTDGGDHANNG